MAFWNKWLKKKKRESSGEWEELVLNDALSPLPEPLAKPLLDAVCGRLSPLEAKPLLEDFTKKSWTEVKPHLAKMAMGKIPAAPWVLEILCGAYPKECGAFLLPHAKEMPAKNCLALFSAVGAEQKDAVAEAVVALLPQLPTEEIGSALRVLALYPTEKGNAALAAYLTHEDWRVVMKAASALGEARAKDYLPQLKALAAQGGFLGDGVSKIVKEMEG